jgi:hypothetical protein
LLAGGAKTGNFGLKSTLKAQKPKKTVEILSFSIDFARLKAALF